ncbi:NAD(P)-dependent glycerol-3-phosphate dehydrogenase [Simkania negevensis]|uniref:Glycerol-3-phosphate dehydrogenase [NAD(P)+] n=1 Tax=Simkania negevensis TaxID=83561 RepID=A0ABS3APY7_9BACT|nr:NAD(P)-dependent glycerol-3-phosphate dehydrogenase [Simkania negevensis]
MNIGYLGAGSWATCLASLLASKGHEVTVWARNTALANEVTATRNHPHLPGATIPDNVRFTTDLADVVKGKELLVEGVTSAGVRPVFEEVKRLGVPSCPIVITSKGIEQNTGMLFSDVIADVFGESMRAQIGCLSGPSHAEEVVMGLPTSVVCSAYNNEVMHLIQQTFTTHSFRVYPNSDIAGIEFCGAMKNVIAIACGISDGIGFGDNSKAALLTRGLHEMRKLAVTKGCRSETLNGLAGMGDLCVTCFSPHSRNYKFGRLLAQGLSMEKAREKIGMVVEGCYSCVSVRQLGKKNHVPLPITEAVYAILYENLTPKDAVKQLLQRAIKEEHL